MHFLLGFLLGYYTRNKPLLAATLVVIALLCFIVLPAIALSGLYLSVRRERLSRPPQTRVPPVVGLDYKTAETALHNSKLNIRVLAHRYDPPVEPGKILFQTPQAGESVACGTVVGIVISKEDYDNKKAPFPEPRGSTVSATAVILPCNRGNCDIPVRHIRDRPCQCSQSILSMLATPAENCSR